MANVSLIGIINYCITYHIIIHDQMFNKYDSKEGGATLKNVVVSDP